MYKVLDKFLECFVVCNKFKVNLSEATQEQLEHLYHLGHNAIVLDKKKPKNKLIDNFKNEDTDNIEGE